jgi:hypothetical protein
MFPIPQRASFILFLSVQVLIGLQMPPSVTAQSSSSVTGGSSVLFSITGDPESASPNNLLVDTNLWDEFPITLLDIPDYNVAAYLNSLASGTTPHITTTTPAPPAYSSSTNASTTTPAPTEEDSGLSWWMIMLIVVSSVLGIVALSLGIYFGVRANSRHAVVVTPSGPLPPASHMGSVSSLFRNSPGGGAQGHHAYSKISIQVPLVNHQIITAPLGYYSGTRQGDPWTLP